MFALAVGALQGSSGSQTSGEIGCVKYASDQIQPTASNLYSQSLEFLVLGLRLLSRHLGHPRLVRPECFVSLGLQLGGEGPGEDRPHPQAVS